MSDEELNLPDDLTAEIEAQAESAIIETQPECTMEQRVHCATLHGPRAVESKILVSMSENINAMADAIKESERQKHFVRAKCVKWFIGILVFLVLLASALILADTFFHVTVRMEFLVSVILAILADVFAIVHTLIKYMTNVENYEAYSNLIDSLLKHIDHK